MIAYSFSTGALQAHFAKPKIPGTGSKRSPARGSQQSPGLSGSERSPSEREHFRVEKSGILTRKLLVDNKQQPDNIGLRWEYEALDNPNSNAAIVTAATTSREAESGAVSATSPGLEREKRGPEREDVLPPKVICLPIIQGQRGNARVAAVGKGAEYIRDKRSQHVAPRQKDRDV